MCTSGGFELRKGKGDRRENDPTAIQNLPKNKNYYDDKQRALDSSGRERFGSLGRALLGSLPPFWGGSR